MWRNKRWSHYKALACFSYLPIIFDAGTGWLSFFHCFNKCVFVEIGKHYVTMNSFAINKIFCRVSDLNLASQGYTFYCQWNYFRPTGCQICYNRHQWLQSLRECLKRSLVFMWNSAMREGFNFYFSVVFGEYWKNFHFGTKTGH